MYNKEWYKNLKRSKLSPPNYVFGIVWPILYCLMLISVILLVLNKDNDKLNFKIGIAAFTFQLIFNLIWTTIFFKLQRPNLALLDLLLTLTFTVISIYYFYKVYPISSYLLIPYVLWLSFAAYLNSYIVLKN